MNVLRLCYFFIFLSISTPDAEGADTINDNIFPDYEPKRTPDTILDYMPELAEEYYKIPDTGIVDE